MPFLKQKQKTMKKEKIYKINNPYKHEMDFDFSETIINGPWNGGFPPSRSQQVKNKRRRK